MRCNICDATLGEDSVQWNSQHNDWDPCPTCLIAISELFNDDSEEEISEQIEFEFGEEDIIIPEKCPILDTPLVYGSTDRNEWPSVDKVDPLKGYVKGNIAVVSYRANRMKSNMTIDDVRRLLALMEKHYE